MKKILYIVTQSEWGGAQRYIFDLARLLSPRAGFEIHMAAGGNGEPPSSEGMLFERSRGQNITVHKLKHLVRPISPIHDFLAYFELKKLIATIKPDIVHLNSSKAGVLGSMAAQALNVPKIIYTAHGFVFNEPMNPAKRRLYKQAELKNAKRVHKIIAVSEYDRKTGIAAGIPSEKLITIHNGIDAAQMHFLSREEARLSLRGATRTREATRQSYQRTEARFRSNVPQRDVKIAASASTPPRNDMLIGAIANFYPTKGLDILIRAMRDIDARLVIIGEGALQGELESLIKKLELSEKIILAGALPDAARYLKAFDLFVLASRKEGLPYTLLEAAVGGVPVVATRVGGIPEVIQDGVNGYLVEPNNPEGLSQAMQKGLSNPLPIRLEPEFSLQRMVEETIKVYQS